MARSISRARLNAAKSKLRQSQRKLESELRRLERLANQNRYWIACPCGYADTLSYMPSSCPCCGRRVAG